jgi:hypothetical protein
MTFHAGVQVPVLATGPLPNSARARLNNAACIEPTPKPFYYFFALSNNNTETRHQAGSGGVII